eukprot:TRINITY_DN38643_c0_g1_i1.p1 TRINITY_DN38643_c0_g1~~TRINITY_DN38643_c0_g1_i1.p1  ORF type:complete len:341 (-),score=63.18 TRINITY_DN38643_c0_g1_i1:69-1091(-)
MDAASGAPRPHADGAAPAAAAATPASTLASPSGGCASNGGESPQVLRYCDFQDFVRHLGVDPQAEADDLVMVGAQQMFSAALPTHWSEHIDEGSGRVYFFNELTGESLWMHPQETLFKELLTEVRSWRTDMSLEQVFARSDAHLKQAYTRSVEGLSQWSGPYDAPQGGPEEAPEFAEASAQFYYNNATGESRWVDPRQGVEEELRLRHAVLCACMATREEHLAKLGGSGADSEEDENGLGASGTRRPETMQAFVRSLWDSLGALPLPARGVDGLPGDMVPPQGQVRRPQYLPEGNDTVRSSMSYLTARSTTSCTEEARMADVEPADSALHPFVLRPSPRE